MSKQANYRLIGLFVVGAISLLVGAVAVFGSGALFQDNIQAVMFFNESVKGLQVGAPVTYRGVPVGVVKSFNLMVERGSDQMFIPVQIELKKAGAEVVGHDTQGSFSRRERLEFMKHMIKRGLRAQLALESIVTGQLYILLDLFPGTPEKLLGLEPAELEIPTMPSGLEQFKSRLRQIPIDEIAHRLNSALTKADALLGAPEAADAIKSLDLLLKESRTLVNKVDQSLELLAGEMRQNMNAVAGEARLTLRQTGKSMAQFEAVTGKDSPLYYRLNTALDELGRAARALRVLADYLERHPEALIQGKRGSGGR
jgi:paraquat-inducible protein B